MKNKLYAVFVVHLKDIFVLFIYNAFLSFLLYLFLYHHHRHHHVMSLLIKYFDTK